MGVTAAPHPARNTAVTPPPTPPTRGGESVAVLAPSAYRRPTRETYMIENLFSLKGRVALVTGG